MTSIDLNVIGYLRSENGLGQASRLTVAAAEAEGIDHAEVVLTGPHRERHPFAARNALHDPKAVNLVCANADAFRPIAEWLGRTVIAERPTVGWWAWEVDQFPAWMAESANYVDEVWAYSEFGGSAIRGAVDAPVHVFRPAIPLVEASPRSRAELGIGDAFVFLFCFDYLSVFERKNPLGVLAAFTRAFAPGEGPILILKGVNANRDQRGLDALTAASAERPDVRIWNDYIDAANQRALMASCDAYVSLHRSEGFGLTMAEAMAMGKPVIATAYSGNLDFMDEENSFLVPAELVPVGPAAGPYPATASWAAPDLDVAAAHMRRVVTDAAMVRRITDQARRSLEANHSLEVRGRELRRLLAGVEPRSRTPLATPTAIAHVSVADKVRFKTKQRVRFYADSDELHDQIMEVSQRVDVLHLAAVDRIDELERQVGALRAQLSAPPYVADPSLITVLDDTGRERLGFDSAELPEPFYIAFEKLFRGPEEFVRDRLRLYVDVVRLPGPVIDVGCGRGEFLGLLAEAGVDAWGIEQDPNQARVALDRGRQVEVGEALGVLEVQPDNSAGVVFSTQFLEHLTAVEVEQFVRQAARVLRPGGRFVAETVNPYAIDALRVFWLDPSHQRPVYPEALLLLCRAAGFRRAIVMHPHGSGDLDADRGTQGEYAVVADLNGVHAASTNP